MITGKQLGKRLRNGLLYLTAFTVCMTSIPIQPALAAEAAAAQTEVSAATEETTKMPEEMSTEAETLADAGTAEESREYTEEELYEISGGDAEYWKYYDAE